MSIYAIWGAPQTGKTTLAVNLAYAVSRGDQSVCLISPVAYSELSAFLGVKIPEENSLGAALRGAALRQTAFKADELFYVLASPSAASALYSVLSGSPISRLPLGTMRTSFASRGFSCTILDASPKTSAA